MKSARSSVAAARALPLPWTWELFQAAWFLLPLLPGIGAVGCGVVMIATWQQQWRQLRRDRLLWGFGLLSLWLMLSASCAAQPGEAWLGLANLIPFFFLFAALRYLLRSPAQLRRLTWLSLAGVPLVVGLGLGQLWLQWTTSDFWYTLSGWRLVAGGNPPGRLASTFMYANLLAFYLAMVWTLGLGLGLNLWQQWRRQRRGGKALLFWLVAMAAIALGLLLAQSRNAWGLAVLSTLVFALIEGWYWLLLAVGAAASAFAWAAFAPQWGGQALRRWLPAAIWARLSDDMFPERATATLRTTQWQFTWALARERPRLGWGLRNFSPLYEAEWGLWLGHPHNLYLMLLAETGWPALLGLSLLVGSAIAPAVRNLPQLPLAERRTAIAYLIAFGGAIAFNCLDVTLFDLRSNTIGWVLLSAIAGIGHWFSPPAAATSSLTPE